MRLEHNPDRVATGGFNCFVCDEPVRAGEPVLEIIWENLGPDDGPTGFFEEVKEVVCPRCATKESSEHLFITICETFLRIAMEIEKDEREHFDRMVVGLGAQERLREWQAKHQPWATHGLSLN